MTHTTCTGHGLTGTGPQRKRSPWAVAGLCVIATALTPVASAAQQAGSDSFLGTVRASDLFGLSYGARGCIVEVSESARSAQVANAGQVLVRLDNQQSDLALRSSQARVQDLEAAVEERQLAIDAAIADDRRRQDELAFVTKEAQRNRTLFGRGLINETTLEGVERRIMDANFAAERAQEAIANAVSAKKRAEIALEIGKLDLQVSELANDDLTIAAPFDGVLVNFEENVGDCVQEGELAAQIYAPDRKAVDIFVQISDLAATDPTGVAIGAPVRVNRVNGQACGGTITRIDSQADLETQYVKATIDVDQACAPELFLNEAVEVEAAESTAGGQLGVRDATEFASQVD